MNRRLPLIFAFCLAAGVWGVSAAPLKRADLPAHPAWVLHVDCDALRQTYLGKYLLYQMDKPEMKSNMVAFQSIFTFDLRTQIHGVTVYNDSPAAKDCIVIAYADIDCDRLSQLVQGGEGAETITNKQQVFYSWLEKTSKHGGESGFRRYAAFQGGRVIAGTNKESMIAALAVLDGAAPNLAASKLWPELGAPANGNFIQAAGRKFDFLGSQPGMALLKSSRQARFRASEVDEQITAVLTAEAGDEITARQMSIAAQGLIALMSLQSDNPQTAKLTDDMSVKRNGNTVTLTLAGPSTDLVAALKAYDAKKGQP